MEIYLLNDTLAGEITITSSSFDDITNKLEVM